MNLADRDWYCLRNRIILSKNLKFGITPIAGMPIIFDLLNVSQRAIHAFDYYGCAADGKPKHDSYEQGFLLSSFTGKMSILACSITRYLSSCATA